MLTFQAIQRAAEIIKGTISHTPCLYSRTLSNITGAEVFLKYENLQFTGSFKERGALLKLLSLTPAQSQKGVIAMSAGNHAQAVAFHAQRLGIPAVIVMPRLTPNVKVEHTRDFGAEVFVQGEGFDETTAIAQKLAKERGLSLVHPYDDETIITGQGTVALELLDSYPDLEVLLVPVGGGGLAAGSVIAAHGRYPSLHIFGVQTERFPSMAQALDGRSSIVCGQSTIAEGIAVKTPGTIPLAILKEHLKEMLLVGEQEIEEAVLLFLQIEKMVVEGAGAAGLAALIKYRERFKGRKIGVIVSGGNIDLLILSSIIQRGLVRSGRLVSLKVELRDIPGALAQVSKCVSSTDANIVEVHHQRAFTNLPLQSAEVELVLLTRGNEHVRRIMEALTASGFPCRFFYPDQEPDT